MARLNQLGLAAALLALACAGDDAYTQQIYDLSGLDCRAAWQRHGQAWDSFVEEMWAQYR